MFRPKSTRKKGQNLKLIDRAAHLTFRANLQHVLNGKAEVTRNYVRFLPHPRRLTCGSKRINTNCNTTFFVLSWIQVCRGTKRTFIGTRRVAIKRDDKKSDRLMLKTRLMTVPPCMENAGPGLKFNRGNYQNI